MIRVNDRHDPQQQWVEVAGTTIVDAPQPDQRAFTAPQSEFTARLATTGAVSDRFSVAIGDPTAEEGQAPDVWRGVVESWQPSGSQLLVICRPARSVQEGAGTLLPMADDGVSAPRTGGVGA